MGKSLVIVESPAKAKTINKYLGNSYIVKSSVGYIFVICRLPAVAMVESEASFHKRIKW